MTCGGSSGAEVGSHMSAYSVMRQQYSSIQTIFFKNLNFLKIFSAEFLLFSESKLDLGWDHEILETTSNLITT